MFDGTLVESERGRLSINGALDVTAPITETVVPNSPAPVRIGNLNGGGSIMEGRIDEVAIWTRALSADELAQLAAGALADE